ncbi:hypothetical protein EDD18DRAFT_1173810, partial [Armillaria luteobubalina]
MIILEEDECTPLKGDSTTPVSPTSPSQLSSPDSPPSYNEAVVCNSFSRHLSYDAIPIPETLSLESLDRVSDNCKRRRRRNKHRVHMMLLFLALTGCIIFWLTFAFSLHPVDLLETAGEIHLRGRLQMAVNIVRRLRKRRKKSLGDLQTGKTALMVIVSLSLQTMLTEALAASIVPFYNISSDLTSAKPPEDR